jgi:protein subunit release factor B
MPTFYPVTQLNTRVELRFNVSTADWIPEDARLRMIQQQKHRINKAGELVISVQEHRCVHDMTEAETRPPR